MEWEIKTVLPAVEGRRETSMISNYKEKETKSNS